MVRWLNGQFLAGGDDGTILTSTDGISWTSQTSGVSEAVQGMAYGNGTYVAVGGSPEGQFIAVGDLGLILTSPDGATWSRRASPSKNFLEAIAFSNGYAVIVGDNGTILQSGPLVPSAPVLAGAYEQGGYRLTISGDAGTPYRVQTSIDLAGWTDLGFLGDRQGGDSLLDTNATQLPSRMYRALWP